MTARGPHRAVGYLCNAARLGVGRGGSPRLSAGPPPTQSCQLARLQLATLHDGGGGGGGYRKPTVTDPFIVRRGRGELSAPLEQTPNSRKTLTQHVYLTRTISEIERAD